MYFEKNTLIIKEWWDPGKNPNTWKFELATIESESCRDNVLHFFSEDEYKQVIAYAGTLN